MDTRTLHAFRMRVQAEAASATAELARCEQAFASAEAAFQAEQDAERAAYRAYLESLPFTPDDGDYPPETDEEHERFQVILRAHEDARKELTAAQHRAEAASRMLAKVRMLCR